MLFATTYSSFSGFYIGSQEKQEYLFKKSSRARSPEKFHLLYSRNVPYCYNLLISLTYYGITPNHAKIKKTNNTITIFQRPYTKSPKTPQNRNSVSHKQQKHPFCPVILDPLSVSPH